MKNNDNTFETIKMAKDCLKLIGPSYINLLKILILTIHNNFLYLLNHNLNKKLIF